MAVFTAEQKTLSRQLITAISGLQSHEENFELCFQFVSSNFRYHRFLDVDSFKISRSIRGLVEKFSVHAQLARAEALESLTDQFLSHRLHSNYAKSEMHYGVLQLLLCLSDQPTSAEWTPAHGEAPAQDLGDDFDWAAYLREGIELPTYSDTDSEWSQLSEDERETQEQLADSTLSDSAVGEELSDHDDTLTDQSVQVSQSRSWLLSHVVFPYWNQSHPFHRPQAPPPASSPHDQLQPLSLQPSAHPACGIADKWRAHREKVDPFVCPVEPVTVEETNVVRETLWLLLGAEDSFVYTVGQEGVGVRRGVQLSHLTPLALQRHLQQFASVATLLLRLRRFINSVSLHMCSFSPPSPSSSPSSLISVRQTQTSEAAAEALTCCLERFCNQLRAVERRVLDQKEFVSLLRLSAELQPACRDVKVLCDVLSAVIQPVRKDEATPTPHQCSAWLLDSLWNGMQYYDTLGEAGTSNVAQLFPLWVMCVRPYLTAVGEWMVQGVLQDRHHELCIVRNEEVVAGRGDYWERCFTLSQPVPEFLLPVVDKVMLAGKSMQLIESTGKMRQAEKFGLSNSMTSGDSSTVAPSLTTPPSPTLYEEFLESLREELLPERKKEDEEEADKEADEEADEEADKEADEERDDVGEGAGVKKEVEEVSVAERGRQERAEEAVDELEGLDLMRGGRAVGEEEEEVPLELRGMSSMLQHYLLSLTSHPPPLSNPSKVMWEELQTIAGCPRHTPIAVLAQKCLVPLIHNRYRKASGCLMHILHTEFHLLDHFRTVQLFLLMEAGDTMHSFASDIFLRIQRGEPWQDSLYLNSLLQEVLQPHYPHLETCLSVQVDGPEEDNGRSRATVNDLLDSITALSLHYEVPWPVTAVFTPALMSVYNEVFHFLMQVKWAKWSLEGVRVKAHSGSPLPPDLSLLLHQLLLLRSRLLHFVNSLYHYLMTRILHSIGLQFQGKVCGAEDLDTVLSLHREYVTTLFDRCLLNKKASIVKEAILKTLRLTLTFRQKWERGLATFSRTEGETIESEFSKCSHFLVTCLNNTVRRGSFPYLETLAFSLSTLKTDQKIFTPKPKTRPR